MGSIFFKKLKKWVFDLLFPHFRFHFLAGVFGMSTPIWARCLIWATYRLLHSLVLRLSNLINLKFKSPGSGYGAVGRAVASNTRDPRFESSHRQYYILSTQLKNCIEKTKIEKKEAGNGPFFKKKTTLACLIPSFRRQWWQTCPWWTRPESLWCLRRSRGGRARRWSRRCPGTDTRKLFCRT